MMNTRKNGFTLIELIIVIAIVALLVALAVPSFQDALRKSRRSDAMSAIMNVHLAQERYRAHNITYGSIDDLNLDGDVDDDTMPSPDGHYDLTIDTISPSTYTIVAEALNDQADDICGDFTLTNDRGEISKTADRSDLLCWKK